VASINLRNERDKIAAQYDEALEHRYQLERKLVGNGKLPHEIRADPAYLAAEDKIRYLQETSRYLSIIEEQQGVA